MSTDCVFCKIVSGEFSASMVAEDKAAIAFMDIRPFTAGHVLIIPRRHASAISDLSEEEAGNIFRLVHRIARALPQSGVRCEGYHISQANGAAAGQEVFHAHFHLVPRFSGDSVRLLVDPNRPKYSRKELNQIAQRIASAMKGTD
jgi:diadenosine tetraphosphate (Ap4A) HIT family hydrolase